MKGWLKALGTVAVAWFVEWLLARWLVWQDAVTGLLVPRSLSTVSLVALLLVLRLFLIFVAPAWLLWRVVSAVERRFSAQSNSTVPDKIA